MQQRRGTAAQWISTNSGNGPVLNAGEIGFEIDNNRFKIGDGVNHWVDLPYFSDNQAITDLIDGAPDLLNTLGELANALGDDPAFITTVATNLSDHESDTTNVHGIADTADLATQDYVTDAIANSTGEYPTLAGDGLAWDAVNEAFDVDTTIARLESPTFTGTVSGITKSMVGLGNVDNTSDADKVISTATQDALDLKAPLANPTFTGTVSGITKSMVGLSNVDNTSDANKQISTATQQALDLKAPIDSPTFSGTVSGITKAMVGLANVTNTADADKPISTATQAALDLKADIASPTFTGTAVANDLTVESNLVVDGNLTVSGTTTTVSTANFTTSDALIYLGEGNNANLVDLGIVSSFDDGTYQHAGIVRDSSAGKWKLFKGVTDEPTTTVNFAQGSLDDLAVGALEASELTVGSVTNTEIGYLEGLTGSIQDQLSSKLGATAAGFIYAPIASPTFTGTVSGVTKAMVGLGNVDNTSDMNKPTSTAVSAELALKLDITDAESTYAPLESPTFTGTVAGITKSMVGLSDVDNTSDADKAISTATQAALDLKAPSESPTFTGTVTLPANTISQSMMDDSSVGTAELQNLAVTAEKIDAGAVTNEKLNGSIEWTKLQVSSTVSATEIGYIDGVTSSVQDQLDDKAPLDSPTFTGTVSGVTKSMVGLGNVDNTADADKPVSTATQTALDAKLASATAASTYAPIANPTFTGTVSGVTKAHVGLGNVDNTSDADKPVSTATQDALDLKADLAGPTLTGTTTTADLVVNGDFTVNGTNFSASATSITIEDNMLQLAHQNSGNTVDLGLVVAYNDGSAKHSGLVRDVSDSKWKLFKGVTTEPSTTVDFTQGSLDDLAVAALTATTVTPSSGVVFSDGTQTKEGVPSRKTISQKTDSYTLSALTERDSMIEINKSTAVTLTVPADSTVDYPVGTSINILQTGAGQVTIAPVSGTVTINATPGLKLRAQWSSATLLKRAANTWVLLGDLSV